jgi:dihydroneopterin aldolase
MQAQENDMDGSDDITARPAPDIANAWRKIRHVFIRDLIIEAQIGVWEKEKTARQRIRVNVDLGVEDRDDHLDRIENVVCYHEVIKGIRTIIAGGHIHLAETLAEEIARMALADPRVSSARIRVEKLDIVADAASVGVEIERIRPL